MFKKMFKTVSAFLLAPALLLTGVAVPALPTAAADDGGTKQAPLKTMFTTPASDWESECLPIGNGFIGGMIYGGVGSDQIQTNEHTLWSGGPGSVTDYNFGIKTDSAVAKDALQQLRGIFQNIATDFSTNKAAYIGANGKVVSQSYDYGSYAAQIAALEPAMYGSWGGGTVFGSYQTLSDINIADPASAEPRLTAASSNYDPVTTGTNEVVGNLFDGNTTNKWFSGNTGKTFTFPATITWQYNKPYTTDSYSLTSANDDYGRDPKAWTLSGSDNGTDWTVIDTQTDFAFTVTGAQNESNSGAMHARGETKTLPLGKTVSYQYYQINITATSGNNPPQLAELSLNDLNAAAAYSNYTRELDLDSAVAKVQYDTDGVTYNREYFTSNPGNFMAIRLTASQPGALNREISISSIQPNKTITASGDTVTMIGSPSDAIMTKPTDQRLVYAQQLKVIPQGSNAKLTTGSGEVDVTGADSILIIMSAGTNYIQCTDFSKNFFSEDDPLTAVSARVNAAAAQDYSALLAAHEADYTNLYDRVKLDIGAAGSDRTTKDLLAGYKAGTNTAAENRYLETVYYQLGRYLLISSSRDGSLPANLQGLWANTLNTPWSGDYHTNINVEMNYWPAEQTNLTECHTPMFDFINSLVKAGEYFAQYYYIREDGGPVRGWAAGGAQNIWNQIANNDSEIGFVPTTSAWLCQDLWEHYQFTMDKSFLADNYDTLMGAALFWVDNLWTDTRDNTLVVNPSYSPENGLLGMGTTFDQAIVWQIFDEVLQAGKVLGYTSSDLDDVQAAMDKLSSPLRIGLAGQFMEWKDETSADDTGSGQQRHANQLVPLHPGDQVVPGRSAQDDMYADAIKVTLGLRGDGGTGWSMAWKINFWARLLDGNHAETMVHQILTQSTLSNLLDTCPPFQIDGNFGATSGMTEMLLQSQGDGISFLPAVPDTWANGSVSGLKARGNFEVGMTWADKMLTSAAVTSDAGGNCVLNYGGLDKATVTKASDGSKVAVTVEANGMISFPTVKGETYNITGIPAHRLPNPRVLMSTITFNDIYNDALLQQTGAPDDQGSFIQLAPAASIAAKLGLKVNDVITSLNGTPVPDTATLDSLYAALNVGDPVKLTALRQGEAFTVSFTKPTSSASYPNNVGAPCTLQAAGYDGSQGGAVSVRAGDLQDTLIAGAGAAVGYNNINFPAAVPPAAVLHIQSDAAATVEMHLGSAAGPLVATFQIPNTGGKFADVSAALDPDSFNLTNSIWLVFSGPAEVTTVTFTGSRMLGDVDGNGAINTIDARMVLQHIVSKITLTGDDKIAADVNSDGKIDTVDARLILQYIVGKIQSFS